MLRDYPWESQGVLLAHDRSEDGLRDDEEGGSIPEGMACR